MNSPEPVLTDAQWAVASRALNYAIGGGGSSVNIEAPVFNARVFVGTREITDIVRVEIDGEFASLGSAVTRQAAQS